MLEVAKVCSSEDFRNTRKLVKGSDQIEGTAHDLAKVIYLCGEVRRWRPDLTQPGVKEKWDEIENKIIAIIESS